jgi:hypothetical protein
MPRRHEEVECSVRVDVIGIEAAEVVPELGEEVMCASQLKQALHATGTPFGTPPCLSAARHISMRDADCLPSRQLVTLAGQRPVSLSPRD